MQRNYNYIYSKLVENDTDLIGHIAYSLYKKSKVEYIEKKKAEGATLTDNDLIPFNDFSSSESSIESYRIKAEIIMQGFVENVLDEELESYREQAINQQADILNNIIAPLKSTFWSNVWAGLLSAFIFALLLAAIAFIIQFNGSSINVNVEKNTTDTENKQPK
jgi:hypothetical protein